jgi:hypothetical protein
VYFALAKTKQREKSYTKYQQQQHQQKQQQHKQQSISIKFNLFAREALAKPVSYAFRQCIFNGIKISSLALIRSDDCVRQK